MTKTTKNKKSTKKQDISNKDVSLTENDIAEVVSALLETKKVPKQQQSRSKFYLSMFMGLSAPVAAKLAGFSESYGYKLMTLYRRDIKIRAHIEQLSGLFPERYRSICKLRLAEMAGIEAAALEEYKKDPQLAIKRPALLKQIKQSAGLLGDNTPGVAPTINIAAVQNLALQIQRRKEKDFSDAKNLMVENKDHRNQEDKWEGKSK